MSVSPVNPKMPVTLESNLPVKTCSSKICDFFHCCLSKKTTPIQEDSNKLPSNKLPSNKLPSNKLPSNNVPSYKNYRFQSYYEKDDSDSDHEIPSGQSIKNYIAQLSLEGKEPINLGSTKDIMDVIE